MSKIGIVIGVSSAYSTAVFAVVDLDSPSELFACSGTVVNFRGDPVPLAGKFDKDSTELSIGDIVLPSYDGDPRL
jgi:hypothetical protein